MRHFVGGERKWPIPFKIQQYLTDPWLSDKSNISKIRKIIKSDGRCTIRDIDKTVGIYIFCGYISFWSGFSPVKNISVRWILHILSDDQNSTNTNR